VREEVSKHGAGGVPCEQDVSYDHLRGGGGVQRISMIQ
jgi:hypothetical protein